MINLAAVSKFIAKFLFIFFIGIVAGNQLNGIQKKITKSYVSKGNAFFKSITNQKKVSFKTIKQQAWMIKIQAFDIGFGKNNWCTLNIWGIFYLPFMLYVSLIFATHFKRWLTKFISFGAGLLLLFLYFYTCTYFKISHLFHTIDQSNPDFVGGVFYDAVSLLNVSFIDNVNIYLLVALLIWFLLGFCKEDFVLGVEDSPSPASLFDL